MEWKGHNYEHMHRRRADFLDVDRIIKAMEPKADDIVIDVGSGDGIFSLRISGMVREVYPVDINSEAHRIMKKSISESGIRNIHPVQADVCEGIPVTGYNSVLLMTSFHDFECRDRLLEEFKRNSRGRLKITIIEFKKEETSMGPPMEIRISREDLDEQFRRHGFASVYYDEMGPLYINRYEPA